MHKPGKTLSMIIMAAIIASIAITASANQAGFSISPNFPENQYPGSTGFFDLRVIPGQCQEISINIINSGDEDMTVEINLFTAGTNRNGIVDYTTEAIADKTMAFPFSQIASSPAQDEVIIPAGHQTTVPIFIDIPEDGFDGIILGSIHVLRGISEEERTQAGMFVNRFAQVIIVRLQENYNPVPVDFILGDVGLETLYHSAAIVSEIRNPKPRLTMGAVINAQVYPVGQDTAIFAINDMKADFAPNSVLRLSMIDRAGYGISAGDYIARYQIEHNGEIWGFEREFTIGEKIGLDAANNQQAPDGGIKFFAPTLQWVMIVGVCAVILVSAATIYYITKKISKKRCK